MNIQLLLHPDKEKDKIIFLEQFCMRILILLLVLLNFYN